MVDISLIGSILGPNVGLVFSIKISPDEIVDALKEKIKEKNTRKLEHIDVAELILWKVSDPTRYDP